MLKLLSFLMLILSFTVYSQMNAIWERSASNSNIPSWFGSANTDNTERGLAFASNNNNPRIYVVSRKNGLFIRILNAFTGTDVDTLKTNGVGISGGTFALNDVGCSYDGVIFAGNLITSASSDLKIYRWSTETSLPTVVFQKNFGGTGDNVRIGDKIFVAGRVTDNTIKIYLANKTSDASNQGTSPDKVYVLKTNDFGNSFFISDSVLLPATTFGASPAICPIPNDTTFITNSNGRSVTWWSYSGIFLGMIPGSVVATGSNALTVFGNENNHYFATYQYGAGNENARVVDASVMNANNCRTYTITPILGTTSNPNGTGDIESIQNPDGSHTLFVLSTNNGLGAYRISYPFIMNGRFNENYKLAANKLNNNSGFGSNIDVSGIFYLVTDSTINIGIKSRVDKTNNNGIGLLFGLSNLTGTGIPAGQSLGNVPNGGHFFGNTGNNNWSADFEVQYGIVFNPGNVDSVVYVDAVKYSSGNKIASYLGYTRTYGSTSVGPSVGGVFSANSVKFGFDSAYGDNRGFEISIPRSELGNPTNLHSIKFFTFVVSSTAYFSNVTVPGNVSGGNPGFNVNFNTFSGGPYSTPSLLLPVELISFTGNISGKSILLNWETATETNNSAFEILKSNDNIKWTSIGFIKGKGNSTSNTHYSFIDGNLIDGKYFYKLKQIDLDGSYYFSEVISIEIGNSPNEFILYQNYPNPFNPKTKIKYQIAKIGQVTLKIFDILGNEVATLVDEVQESGNYEVEFNVKAKLRLAITSGVYFYQLRTGEFVSTKKFILMK